MTELVEGHTLSLGKVVSDEAAIVERKECSMSKRDWGIDDPAETYWYNSRTGAVEEGKLSLSIDRLGPFSTREEAARGPEIVAERARKLREEEDLDD